MTFIQAFDQLCSWWLKLRGFAVIGNATVDVDASVLDNKLREFMDHNGYKVATQSIEEDLYAKDYE